MAKIDFKDMELTIEDGTTGTPKSITIKVGEGTFTYNEQVTREFVLDRGALDTVTNGDQVPMEVSFGSTWEKITVGAGVTGGVPTIEDALKQRGAAANWVSTSDDICEPYCVNIKCTYTPREGCGTGGTIVLPDFFYESLGHNLSEGVLDVSGKCNATEAIVA